MIVTPQIFNNLLPIFKCDMNIKRHSVCYQIKLITTCMIVTPQIFNNLLPICKCYMNIKRHSVCYQNEYS